MCASIVYEYPHYHRSLKYHCQMYLAFPKCIYKIIKKYVPLEYVTPVIILFTVHSTLYWKCSTSYFNP